MKLSKHEQKYRARQQLSNKFTQKESCKGYGVYFPMYSYIDKNAVKKLVEKVCK